MTTLRIKYVHTISGTIDTDKFLEAFDIEFDEFLSGGPEPNDEDILFFIQESADIMGREFFLEDPAVMVTDDDTEMWVTK